MGSQTSKTRVILPYQHPVDIAYIILFFVAFRTVVEHRVTWACYSLASPRLVYSSSDRRSGVFDIAFTIILPGSDHHLNFLLYWYGTFLEEYLFERTLASIGFGFGEHPLGFRFSGGKFWFYDWLAPAWLT